MLPSDVPKGRSWGLRLSAAGRAAYYNEFSFIHGEIYIFKGRLTAKGIFKAKAVYFNCFHFRSSFN